MSSMNPNDLLLLFRALGFLIELPFKIYSWARNSLRNRIKRKQNEGRSAWKLFLPGSIIAIPVLILLIIGIILGGQVGGLMIILSLAMAIFLLLPFGWFRPETKSNRERLYAGRGSRIELKTRNRARRKLVGR